MSNARFDRFVLVWEDGTYCSTHKYTAEEFNTEFSEAQREQLLKGFEVDGVVDLEAFYHRAADLVPNV
jgi:hypothetical protein